jgi:signal transduction histidine kinase
MAGDAGADRRPDRQRDRWRTIRVRQTLLATVVVGLALVAGGAAILALVRHNLMDGVGRQTEQRAADTAALVRLGPLPATLPPAGEDRGLIQVVDDAGRVVAASAELRGQPPLLPERPGTRPLTATLRGVPVGERADYRVVGIRAVGGQGTFAVYAASSLDQVGDGVAATASALGVAVPVLLGCAAAASWWLVGRSLRPLQQAQERQRRFVSDASHELRTPLAAIRTRVEVGLSHPDQTDWIRLAQHVHREGGRLDQLVDELLALSAVDGDGDRTRVEPVDLDELVLAELEALRARGTVAVQLAALCPVRLSGRPEQLRSVVRNLLDNAERHASTAVTVGLSADHAAAELTVADDGVGVPAADRERVFEPFFRLQAARDRRTGGAGLGLAIVRDVVTAHGGTVWFADAAAGAQVHVRLPLVTRSIRPQGPDGPDSLSAAEMRRG